MFQMRIAIMVSAMAVVLSGCATLPSSGPTGSQIYSAEHGSENRLGFRIVELTDMETLPSQEVTGIDALPAPGFIINTNMIGPNDILEIAVYEAGIALFSGGSAGSINEAVPGAKAERLPKVEVDDDGYIVFPYVGRIKAAGHTTTELAHLIADALRGRSSNPEVIVNLQRSITNSVVVSGEVARPGRLPLESSSETILDAIALAGGYRGDPSDLAVKIERNDFITLVRLDELQRTKVGNLRAFAGDRITLLRDPKSFSVMGAAGQTSQIPFSKPSMFLAEAIARSGGSDENQGDPSAIFVFRFVRNSDGTEIPLVYRIDMMKANSYFLAQKFEMRDRDILFVGNARANQPRKMVETLSQLFTPVVTARAVAR